MVLQVSKCADRKGDTLPVNIICTTTATATAKTPATTLALEGAMPWRLKASVRRHALKIGVRLVNAVDVSHPR